MIVASEDPEQEQINSKWEGLGEKADQPTHWGPKISDAAASGGEPKEGNSQNHQPQDASYPNPGNQYPLVRIVD